MWQLASSHNLNFHKFVRFCHFCNSIVCCVLNRDTLEIQDDSNLKHRRWKTDFYFVVLLSCACCWPRCLGTVIFFSCLKYFPCSNLLFSASRILANTLTSLGARFTAGSSTLLPRLPVSGLEFCRWTCIFYNWLLLPSPRRFCFHLCSLLGAILVSDVLVNGVCSSSLWW